MSVVPHIIRALNPVTCARGYFRVDDAGAHPLVGGPFGRTGGPPRDVSGWTRLCPVEPRKIICIGRNYAAHAAELGNTVGEVPTIFEKPVTSLIGPGEAIVRPDHLSALVHHEAELGVVIGRTGSFIEQGEALDHVFGYVCANDITARDLQQQDNQRFCRAKGFDTFCAVGPKVVLRAGVKDPQALAITCRVNGEVRQQGNTRDMAFPLARFIAYLSTIMRLEAGDLLLTGTPAGVGPLLAGDEVEVAIDGLGSLKNPVVNRA